MNETIPLAKTSPTRRRASSRAIDKSSTSHPIAIDIKGATLSPLPDLPTARDKLLFTPGPLTTSLSVKQAMLRDAGSWHADFNAIVRWVREKILQLAELSREAGWEAILLQGSGTFGVESVFATCVPPDGKVAILANGAYGERMVLMVQHLKINHVVFRTAENVPSDPIALDQALAADKTITHVALVHC